MQNHFTIFMWYWCGILFLYLIDEITDVEIQDLKSNCSSPPVRNGSLANITCIFNYDIDTFKSKIYVDHIPSNGSIKATPETVLHCQWLGANFTCNPKAGYKWVGYVANQLTVQIPMTLQTHGGQYVCDFLSSQPLNTKYCELIITDLWESITNINTVNNTLQRKIVKTACVSQRVENGSEAFVNCCFSTDIKELKKTIYVDHLPLNGSSNPETVLTCRWTNENMSCQSSKDYQLNGNVTKELNIRIPRVYEKHAGPYWCDFLASDPSLIKQCNLSITEAHLSTVSTIDDSTDKPDLTVGETVIESDNEATTNVVAIVVPIVVILLILLTLLIVAYLKRWICKSRQRSSSNNDNSNKNQPRGSPTTQNVSGKRKLENGVRNVQRAENADENCSFLSKEPNDHDDQKTAIELHNISNNSGDQSTDLSKKNVKLLDAEESDTSF